MEVSGQLHAPADLPSGKNPGTDSVGSWVRHRAGVDILEERQISCSHRDLNSGSHST